MHAATRSTWRLKHSTDCWSADYKFTANNTTVSNSFPTTSRRLPVSQNDCGRTTMMIYNRASVNNIAHAMFLRNISLPPAPGRHYYGNGILGFPTGKAERESHRKSHRNRNMSQNCRDVNKDSSLKAKATKDWTYKIQ